MEWLADAWDRLITFYQFPREHWPHLCQRKDRGDFAVSGQPTMFFPHTKERAR